MSDQELSDIEMLAAEYVLGSLSGAELERFKQLLDESTKAQRLVVKWQEALVPLNEHTREVEPPPRVLNALMQKISTPSLQTKISWWRNLNLWRPMALGNGILSLCLAIFIVVQLLQPSVETTEVTGDLIYVGVLEDSQKKPKVAVLAYNKPFRLEIKSKENLLAEQDRELRLWMVSRETEQTVFLTSLPVGQTRIEVSDAMWKQLKTAKQLVISADPVEFATSQPSEQVLFKGVCVNLKNWSEKK